MTTRHLPPVPDGPVVAGAGRERAARAAVAAVLLRHVHDDPGWAESDASHERTLQSEQFVEYRADAHWSPRGFEFSQTTKYHGFPVRFFLPLAGAVTLPAPQKVRLSTH
jgi:hypothetical protein